MLRAITAGWIACRYSGRSVSGSRIAATNSAVPHTASATKMPRHPVTAMSNAPFTLADLMDLLSEKAGLPPESRTTDPDAHEGLMAFAEKRKPNFTRS